MKTGLAILFILVGLLIIVFGGTLAKNEERQYSKMPEWHERFFDTPKSAKLLH